MDAGAALRARLLMGPEAWTPSLCETVDAMGPAAEAILLETAGSARLLSSAGPDGWAPVLAVRLLARRRVSAAAPVLLDILEGSEGDDLVSAEAAAALQAIGSDALPAIGRFIAHTKNPHGRVLALEAASNLRGDYASGRLFDGIRLALEALFSSACDATERMLFAGYLSELGTIESVEVLVGAVTRGRPSAPEYEALRDAIERLGGVCPARYFDASGKGYPLDGEKIPLCPECAVRMRLSDSGDLIHPSPRCAGPGQTPSPSER